MHLIKQTVTGSYPTSKCQHLLLFFKNTEPLILFEQLQDTNTFATITNKQTAGQSMCSWLNMSAGFNLIRHLSASTGEKY